MRLEFVLFLAVTVGACAPAVPEAASPSRRAGSRAPAAEPTGARVRPTDLEVRIRAELGRLNRWCSGQDDCDVVERPRSYPGRVPHGETRGFITSAKARLHGLGAAVHWDAFRNRYRLTTAGGPAPPTGPVVRTRADVSRYHGQPVDLLGRYRAVVMPTKRPRAAGAGAGAGVVKDYAIVELADKTVVYLERYNTPLARRSGAERRRYDGKRVRVRGRVHRVCPAARQAPSAACLTAIHKVASATP